MKDPVIRLGGSATTVDGFWPGTAKAIVAAFGWRGLAIACAVVDADYPASEFEGNLPKAFDAYHLPVMALAEDGSLDVCPAAVATAAESLCDPTNAPRLSASARAGAVAKCQRLAAWVADTAALVAFAAKSPEDAAGLTAPPEPTPPTLSELIVIAKSTMPPMLSRACMVAVAEEAEEAKDHAISFVLCHVGTNKNGHHFTLDELKKAAPSAAGVKINLKHGQKAQDIVGKTEKAAFEDTDGGRVVCGGKLFTKDDELAAKARKLIHEKLITKVSMECSYEKAECSICGSEYTSMDKRCEHLMKHQGQTLKGKLVYAILKDITFTGAGLLEGNEPADPNADITAMAVSVDGRMFATALAGEAAESPRPETMKQVLVQQEIREDLWKIQDAFHQVTRTLMDAFVADTETLDGVGKKLRQAATDYADRMVAILKSTVKDTKETEMEKSTAANKAIMDMSQEELAQYATDLETKNQDLQAKFEADEAAKAVAAAKTAATDLVVLMEKKGKAFAKDEDRTAEIERLAALSAEARDAVKSTWEGMADVTPAAGEGAAGTETSAQAAAAPGTLRANASTAPGVAGDPAPKSLGENLKVVLQADYENRVRHQSAE